MMAIDIQTIKGGKIAKTYHMENWLSASASCAPSRARERGALTGRRSRAGSFLRRAT